jgi:outer membrane protein
MKNSNTIINIVLGIGLIVLYILHFTGGCNNRVKQTVATSDSTQVRVTLPIAYINVDSLLLNYNYSKDLNEVLIRKRENAQATLTEKAKKLEIEMQEFQRKRENNAFLSEQSFKSQQQSLLKKQQDLQGLEQNLSNQLAKEQQNLNEQLREKIYKFLREYNKDKKYQVILSNTMNDNILLAEPTYNITNDIVELLNNTYVKSQD